MFPNRCGMLPCRNIVRSTPSEHDLARVVRSTVLRRTRCRCRRGTSPRYSRLGERPELGELARDRGVVDDEAQVLLIDALDDTRPVEASACPVGWTAKYTMTHAAISSSVTIGHAGGSGSRQPSGSRSRPPRTGRTPRLRVRPSRPLRAVPPPKTTRRRIPRVGSRHPGGATGGVWRWRARVRRAGARGIGHRALEDARRARRGGWSRRTPTAACRRRSREPRPSRTSRSGCHRASAG